jgi:hypothetical protein
MHACFEIEAAAVLGTCYSLPVDSLCTHIKTKRTMLMRIPTSFSEFEEHGDVSVQALCLNLYKQRSYIWRGDVILNVTKSLPPNSLMS